MATTSYLNGSNVMGKVYVTSQLTSTPEEKAKELTLLFHDMIAEGIYLDVREAIGRGVPAGSFVLVTPRDIADVKVEIVPATFKRPQ